jgi:Concanavalin A-like lectin/glucanases superfamily
MPTPYFNAVLGDNPQHYWRLADPGGMIAHDLQSPAVALGSSSATPPIFAYTGPVQQGGSIYFESGLGLLNQNTLPLTVPGAVELWFWWIWQPNAIEYLFAWDGVSAGAMDIILDATGHIRADWGTGSAIDPAVAVKQAWHHVVAVNDGATLRLYKDGAQVATAVPSGAGGSFRLNIGRSNTGAAGSAGCIAEVATYGHTLSGAQVLAHFNAADNVAQKPIFRSAGTFDPGSGSTTFAPADLAAILAAVRHTYQNAP